MNANNYLSFVAEPTTSMATNLWRNFSVNRRFVLFVRSFYGALANKDINVKVCMKTSANAAIARE